MFADSGTGVVKFACCQPAPAVSPVTGSVASSVPVEDQRRAVCVPVSFTSFQNLIEASVAGASRTNFVPSS